MRQVEKDPNAITYAALAFSMKGTNALPIDGIEPLAENIRSGSYFLTRPLVLLSREVPRGHAKAFFDFLFTAEGQALVARSFAPLR